MYNKFDNGDTLRTTDVDYCMLRFVYILVDNLSNLLITVFSYLYCKACFLLQATQVKYSTDEFHQRILYEYLAEASVVFPKVFPVV